MLKPYFTKGLIEAGCDEAGRGCLVGPVSAAAVILPDNFKNELLNDSKQLSESDRKKLRPIIEKEAIAYSVRLVDHQKIDEINILQASILGMHLSLEGLDPQPEHILVDGNKFKPYNFIPHTCVVKGDGKYLSIAAASVLAKTYRDDFMEKLHDEFPQYGWNTNKGYPTAAHKKALKEFGETPYQRKTFKW